MPLKVNTELGCMSFSHFSKMLVKWCPWLRFFFLLSMAKCPLKNILNITNAVPLSDKFKRHANFFPISHSQYVHHFDICSCFSPIFSLFWKKQQVTSHTKTCQNAGDNLYALLYQLLAMLRKWVSVYIV